MKEALSPSSEDDLYELHLKAEAVQILKSTLIDSPASETVSTMSEKLIFVEKSDSESQYYTAPSSPANIECIQTFEESVIKSVKSRQKSSNRSPIPQYVTAPSSPTVRIMPESYQTRIEYLHTLEECGTKSNKSTQKGFKLPEPECIITAPSSPTIIKSGSPQALEVATKLKIKRTPLLPSSECLALPDNDRGRREFLLNGYDKRMQKQLAFMAAEFELWSAIESKKDLRDLVVEQKWFEKKWQSPQSEIQSSDKHKEDVEESISGTAIEKRELAMLDDVFHGQALLEVLWKKLDDKKGIAGN